MKQINMTWLEFEPERDENNTQFQLHFDCEIIFLFFLTSIVTEENKTFETFVANKDESNYCP